MKSSIDNESSPPLQLVDQVGAQIRKLQEDLTAAESLAGRHREDAAIAKANEIAANTKAAAAQAVLGVSEQQRLELKKKVVDLEVQLKKMRERHEQTTTTALAKREDAVAEQRSTAAKHSTATWVSLTLLGLQVLGILSLTTELFIGIAFAILMSIGVDLAILRELLDHYRKR